MPYIVQAQESEDHSAVSKTCADRKDALATAVQWVYTAAELAISIINDE